MKNICTAIIFLLLLNSYLFCEQFPSFTIEGDIKDLPDSTVVNLYKRTETNFSVSYSLLGRTVAINGKFNFTVIDEDMDTIPRCYKLDCRDNIFQNGSESIFWSNNNNTKIVGESTNPALWNVENDSPEQQTENYFIEIAKSDIIDLQQYTIKLDSLNEELVKVLNTDPAKRQEIMEKYNSISEIVYKIGERIAIKWIEGLQKTEINNAWISKLKEINEIIRQGSQYSNYKPILIEQYNRLTEDQKNTIPKIGKNLFPINIGDDMVDNVMYDFDGNNHTLSEIKDKYILLDFWFLSCPACVEAIPIINKIANKYFNNLQVVGMYSRDLHGHASKKEAWKKIINKYKITWLNLDNGRKDVDMFTMSDMYDVIFYPHYVLISPSPEYKILDIWNKSEEIVEKIDKYLLNKK